MARCPITTTNSENFVCGQKVNKQFRRRLHKQQQRQGSPSVALIDSQFVKGSVHAGNGYDRAKKVNGRKRHLFVDTLGLVVGVVVTLANISDNEGLKEVIRSKGGEELERLEKVMADQGYKGEVIGVEVEVDVQRGWMAWEAWEARALRT